MRELLDSVITQLMKHGATETLVAAVLLVLGRLLLPREERRELRLPLWLLVLHVLMMVAHRVIVGPHRPAGVWAALAQCLLLTALARVSFLLVVDWLIGKRLNRPLPRIFRDILQALVFLAAALVVFRAVGVDLGSLLTTSAILTAVIGLSLQETLGNLFAGLAVQTESPFAVGDWVEIGESGSIAGRVTEINWRATKIQTADRIEIIVPNSLIARSTIINCHRPSPIGRRHVVFQGPYDVPPNRVRRAVLGALRGCPDLASDPAPILWTSNYADSGIEYTVAYYLERFERRLDIESDIRDRIWYALGRAHISIPFPVRDVRTRDGSPAAAAKSPYSDIRDREAVLRRVDMLEPLPEEVRLRIAETTEELKFGAGEPIVVEGEVADALFVVARGSVVVRVQSPDRASTELARLGPHQLFGEMSLSTGVRGATVQAEVDSVVLKISHAQFQAIIDEVPGLGQAMVESIAARQAAVEEQQSTAGDGRVPSERRNALFQRLRRLFGA
ncbi:MAG: mechanosensitive ion channel [Polyangiaceae bacterium]|nr:mechanosensitive ion channel [Polyangiaceae bacterium]